MNKSIQGINIIRAIALQDFDLPEKSIALPEKIYFECIENAEKLQF